MTDRAYWITQLIRFVVRTLIVAVFLLTPRALLIQVDEKNRHLRPDLVWLNLIPVFDFVWIPITLVKIRSSLRAEHLARSQVDRANESAFNLGLASWLLYIAVNVLGVLPYDSDALLAVVVLSSLAFLCLWIAYWVRLANLKNELARYPGAASAVLVARAPVRVCSSCGAPVYTGDAYCRLCGASTDSATVPAAPAATAEEVPASAGPAGPGDAVPGEGSDDTDKTEAGVATCPFCATPYRPNARFCSCCGRPAI
jgi:hypothetical protein